MSDGFDYGDVDGDDAVVADVDIDDGFTSSDARSSLAAALSHSRRERRYAAAIEGESDDDDQDDSEEDDGDDEEDEDGEVKPAAKEVGDTDGASDGDGNDSDDADTDALTANGQSSSERSSNASTPTATPVHRPINSSAPTDRSGWLSKKASASNSRKRRWFVLSFQTLKYYENVKAKKALGTIELTHASVKDAESSRLPFVLLISTEKRQYDLQCANDDDKRAWMKALKENIDYLQTQKLPAINHTNNVSTHPLPSPSSPRASHTTNSASTDAAAAITSTSYRSLTPADLVVSDEWRKSSGISSRSSMWRREQHLYGVRHDSSYDAKYERTYLSDETDLTYTTAATMNNRHNVLALGSGIGPHLGDGAIQTVMINSATRKVTSAVRFGDLKAAAAKVRGANNLTKEGSNVTRAQLCEGDVTDLSWFDDKLLSGSSGGVVALFNCNPADGVDSLALSKHTSSYFHSKAIAVPTPSPGKWSFSNRIRRVSINPIDKCSFLSILNQSFYLWDMERTSKAVQSEVASNSPLEAAVWNPFSGNEFVIGGSEGVARCLDVRMLQTNPDKCVVWFTEPTSSFSDSIVDIGWSPLVPHWISVASDDGAVKLYDIRFGQTPMKIVNEHTLPITAIHASPSHSELVLTSSADGTTRLFNLRLSPHYTQFVQKADSGIPISAHFSPTHPLQFVTVCSGGQVTLTNIKPDAMTLFTPHRTRPFLPEGDDGKSKNSASAVDHIPAILLSPSTVPSAATSDVKIRTFEMEQAEREIEDCLYTRDFESTFRAVAVLSHRYWQIGRSDWASTLLKVITPGLFTQLSSETPKSTSIAAFDALVNDLSRYIPQNTLTLTTVEQVSANRIQFLKLRIALTKYIGANKYREILALENEILAALKNTSNNAPTPSNLTAAQSILANAHLDTFDALTLERLVQCLLSNDHVKAVQFALRVAIVLRDVSNFTIFVGVAKLLFTPTIHDRINVDVTTDSIDEEGDDMTIPVLPTSPHEDNAEDSQSSSNREESGSRTSSKVRLPRADSLSTNALQSPTAKSPILKAAAAATALSPTQSQITDSATSMFIALDRELRNARAVVQQMEMLNKLLNIISADTLTDNTQSSTDSNNSTTEKGGSSTQQKNRIIYNPFATKHDPRLKLSLETFYLPLFASNTIQAILGVLDHNADLEVIRIVPTFIHRLFFMALLIDQKYDVLIIRLSQLLNFMSKYSAFSIMCNEVLTESIIPQFKLFIDKSLARENNNRLLSINRHVAASIMIVNICHHSAQTSEQLENVCSKSLVTLSLSLSKLLTETIEAATTATARNEIRHRCDTILAQIQRLRSTGREDPVVQRDINKFIQMLESYKNE